MQTEVEDTHTDPISGETITVPRTVEQTLRRIAQEQYGDANRWQEIAAANNLTDGTLDARTVLLGVALTIIHKDNTLWAYDGVGNNTRYVELHDGHVQKDTTKQYDSANHSWYVSVRGTPSCNCRRD